MVNESKSSNRTLFIVLGIAVLALIVAIGAIAAVVLLGGDSGEGVQAAESAKLMPNDTLGYAVFNPHLDQATNFEVIEKAWGDNPNVKLGLAEMLTSMQDGGLDYKADIESWLGDEVGFGMGPNALAAMSGSFDETFGQLEGALAGGSIDPSVDPMSAVPQFVIVAATKDKAASDGFLNKLREEAEQQGTTWKESEYKGFDIVYSEPQGDQEPGIAYATVDDYVVLAVGGLEPIQAVIDARDGGDGDNLAGNPNYQDVMAKLPADQVSYGYIDIAAYMDAVIEAAGSEMTEIPPELFNPDQLDAFKAAGYSFGFEPNGLRVDFAVVYDQEAMPENLQMLQGSANKAAERVPASSLFYMSGSGLGSALQMGLDTIQAMPDQPQDLDEQLQMLTAMFGVSIDELIEMLSGEFAIAVTHDPAGIAGDPDMPVGASILIEAQDEEKFTTLLNSVSSLLALGGEMDLPKKTIGDTEVTMLSDPMSGDAIAGWGVGNGFFVIATSEGMLETAFGSDADTLSAAPIYKEALTPLPKEPGGVLFINLEGLLDTVVQEMSPADRESFAEAQPFLAPVKAISAGVEAYSSDKDSASGTFFILIESE